MIVTETVVCVEFLGVALGDVVVGGLVDDDHLGDIVTFEEIYAVDCFEC
jgi:hypothetical protein